MQIPYRDSVGGHQRVIILKAGREVLARRGIIDDYVKHLFLNPTESTTFDTDATARWVGTSESNATTKS